LENYKEKYNILLKEFKALQLENDNKIRFHIDELNDLKNSHHTLQQLCSLHKKLNNYTFRIEDIASSEIPAFVLSQINEIFGIRHSLFIEYNSQKHFLFLKALNTPGNFVLSIKKLTGIDLFEYTLPSNKSLIDYSLRTKTQKFYSISELSNGVISTSVSKMVQHLFGIEWLQPLALVSQNKLLGYLVLIGEKEQLEISDKDLLQFSSVTANSIQRKLKNQTPIQKNNHFKTILNTLPDMIYVVDPDGYYQDFYSNEKRLSLDERNNVAEKHLSTVYSGKLFDSLSVLLEECRKSGEMRVFEYPLNVNENLHFFEARIFPLNIDEVFMIVRDVSKCKFAEKELAENLAKMNAMMENTDELVWAWSTSNKKIFTNSKFRNLLKNIFQLDLNDDTNLLENLPVRIKKLWLARIAKVLEKGQGVFEDEIIINKCKRMFETSISSIILNEQVIGFTFIAKDITERKQNLILEKELILAKRTAQLKHNFLANLSHEMRTPLMGIVGMSDVLQKTNLDSIQKEYLDILIQSAETMQSVIDSLIEFANIEQEKIELARNKFSLKQLVNNTLAQIPSYSIKDIKFSALFQDDLPPLIISDAVRLGQVINNLLSNAVKFTTRGEIIIKVYQDDAGLRTGGQKATSGVHSALFRIEVIDTGMGLTQEEKQQLFKPFCNFENNFSRETEGTGLGLAVCKGLIHLLGGNIGVESEPGNGSTFWFTFRAEIPNN
jgi:signal transduction histidine kinase